jgi:hypothetical protein
MTFKFKDSAGEDSFLVILLHHERTLTSCYLLLAPDDEDIHVPASFRKSCTAWIEGHALEACQK